MSPLRVGDAVRDLRVHRQTERVAEPQKRLQSVSPCSPAAVRAAAA